MARRAALLLALLALTAAGCGEDDADPAPEPEPRPVAQDESFPSAKGRRLQDVLEGMPEGPRLWVERGPATAGERLEFAVLDDARKPLAGAEVAVYLARRDGTAARGPYLARSGSATRYSAAVPLRAGERYTLAGVVKLDGRLVAARPAAVRVDGGP